MQHTLQLTSHNQNLYAYCTGCGETINATQDRHQTMTLQDEIEAWYNNHIEMLPTPDYNPFTHINQDR